MKNDHFPAYLQEISAAVGSGQLSPENAMERLIAQGQENEAARALVERAVKDHRTALFRQNLRRQKMEERKKASYFIILFIAVAGPVFAIGNPLWYIVASVAAGLTAHYGKPNKPAGAVAGALLLILLFPVTFSLYMSGRSSYLNLELLIPLLLAAVPAFLVSLLAEKLFYNADSREHS